MLFYKDDALFANPPLVTDGGFPRAKSGRPSGLIGLCYNRGLGYSRGLHYLAGRDILRRLDILANWITRSARINLARRTAQAGGMGIVARVILEGLVIKLHLGPLAVWVILEDWDRLLVLDGFIRDASYPIVIGGTWG